MAVHLLAGLVRAVRPLRGRRRLDARRRTFRRADLVGTGGGRVLVVDRSPGGLGLLTAGRALAAGETLPVVLPEGVRWARVAHVRRVAPGLARAGLAFLPEPLAAGEARVYLAA